MTARTPEGPARDCSVGWCWTDASLRGSCFGPSAPELADEVTPLSNNLQGCWGKRHRALGFKDGRVVQKVSRPERSSSPRSRALESLSTHHNHHKWVVWVCSQFFQGAIGDGGGQGAKFLFLHGNFNASTHFPKSVGRPTQSGVVGFSSWQSLGQEMRKDNDTSPILRISSPSCQCSLCLFLSCQILGILTMILFGSMKTPQLPIG